MLKQPSLRVEMLGSRGSALSLGFYPWQILLILVGDMNPWACGPTIWSIGNCALKGELSLSIFPTSPA
jgi:hypothetical protein